MMMVTWDDGDYEEARQRLIDRFEIEEFIDLLGSGELWNLLASNIEIRDAIGFDVDGFSTED